MKYLFGPVNSRRLGMSLGVDLMPHKTCSMNCIYCECGRTTALTATIGEYTPTGEVIDELDGFLSAGPRLDAITFSGSGEPTLHGGIGEIIGHLKSSYPRYRIVVLTNGSLLWNPEVRRALYRADTVVPSLDAVSEEVFRAVNRPAAGIDSSLFIRGLTNFGREYRGELIIEIFIVPGVNDGEQELALMRDLCLGINPRSVQLNTLDRPGTEPGVVPATRENLERVRELLLPLSAEIIGGPGDRHFCGGGSGDMILSTLLRRPSTLDDLASTLGLDREEIRKSLERLSAEGDVVADEGPRGVFYRLAQSL